MKKAATTPTLRGANPADHAYDQFEALVAAELSAPGPLFTTDADPDALWDAYLLSIPKKWRSHYDCHACRNFVKDYGGLVRVLDGGSRASAVWTEEVPEFFAECVVGMLEIVSAAKITGVFLSSEKVIGTASNTSKKTGATWTHFHSRNAKPWKETTLTAGQKMAELREDHGVLCRSFAEYDADVAAETLRVLESDHLDRAGKAVEIVRWYVKVLQDRKKAGLVWRHVATAPLGWCHIKNTVVSTLMDDVKNGVGFDVAKRKWAEKMHPLQYMRPQAAPADGAIEQAEKLVAKLGIQRSLERRFARFEEILPHALWTPKEPQSGKEDGVFGHLRKKPGGVKKMILPATEISADKFTNEILPGAKHITIDVGYTDSFYGLTTSADESAPPILRWDYEDERNPFAWYFYHGGSWPRQWGLASGPHEVHAVMNGPNLWTKDEARLKIHKANGPCHLFFVLKQAKDARNAGLALFPENMRGELHGARSVIEAFSARGEIQGREEASANGVGFNLDRGAGDGGEITVDGTRYHIKGKA